MEFVSIHASPVVAIYQSMTKGLDNNMLERNLVIALALWNEHNKGIHGKLLWPASQIYNWCKGYLQEFQVARCKEHSATTQTLQHNSWKLPLLGTYKLNVDAPLDAETCDISIGALIKADDGFVMGALSKKLFGRFTMKEAKTLAMFHTFQWAIDVHVPLAVIEIMLCWFSKLN